VALSHSSASPANSMTTLPVAPTSANPNSVGITDTDSVLSLIQWQAAVTGTNAHPARIAFRTLYSRATQDDMWGQAQYSKTQTSTTTLLYNSGTTVGGTGRYAGFYVRTNGAWGSHTSEVGVRFNGQNLYAYCLNTGTYTCNNVLNAGIADNTNYVVQITTTPSGGTVLVYPQGQAPSSGWTQSVSGINWDAGNTNNTRSLLLETYANTADNPSYLYSISQTTPSTTALYNIHPDQLGTPRQITTSDTSNTLVWRWDSEPFGSAQPNQDPQSTGTPFVFNLRFPGQYYDAESGLNHNGWRDYNASTGSYPESDPLGLGGGLSTYAYVGGNPVNLIDPTGQFAEAIPAALVAAAVAGAACYVTNCGKFIPVAADAIGKWWAAQATPKPKPGSKPKGCPAGTLPIDEYGKKNGWDKDDLHGVKEGVGAGPRDWTGVTPNGDVITGDGNGDSVNHGPADNYLP